MTDKKSFILYQDYEDQLNLLSDQDAGILFKALFRYNKGLDVSLNGEIRMAFAFIKATLDRDKKKYDARIERSRINGLKGGRPNNNATTSDTQNNPVGFSETQNNLTEPRKPDSDNVNVSDSVSVSVSDNVILSYDNKVILSNESVPLSDLLDQIPLPENLIEKAVSMWQAMASETGVPKIERMTQRRKTKLQKRLKEIGGINGWEKAMTEFRKSSFCQGKNDRAWKMTFDKILEERLLTNLIEGAYADNPRFLPERPLTEAEKVRIKNEEFDKHIAALEAKMRGGQNE
jgi:hypothetical protein